MSNTNEALSELQKSSLQLLSDIIAETNNLPKAPASEKENLDIIKHQIKRLAFHQISLTEKASKTNRILIWLSVIMAIGSLASIIQLILQTMKQ